MRAIIIIIIIIVVIIKELRTTVKFDKGRDVTKQPVHVRYNYKWRVINQCWLQ